MSGRHCPDHIYGAPFEPLFVTSPLVFVMLARTVRQGVVTSGTISSASSPQSSPRYAAGYILRSARTALK